MRQTGGFGFSGRGDASGLWRTTLSQIPSLIGRLLYVTSLRNATTGRYEHYGLAAHHGEDAAHTAIQESHAATFAAWLMKSVEEKKADVDLFLSAAPGGGRRTVEAWLERSPFSVVAPASARESEMELCRSDFAAVLTVLAVEYGLSVADPEDR